MKSKPAFLLYVSCLLAVVLFLSFSVNAWAQEKAATKSRAAKKTAKPGKKDADFWFNKGALLSTYGNNKAAVQ